MTRRWYVPLVRFRSFDPMARVVSSRTGPVEPKMTMPPSRSSGASSTRLRRRFEFLLLRDLSRNVAGDLFEYEVHERGDDYAGRNREVSAAVPAGRTGATDVIDGGGAGATVMIRDRRHPMEREVDRWGCLGEGDSRADHPDDEGDDRVPVHATPADVVDPALVIALEF